MVENPVRKFRCDSVKFCHILSYFYINFVKFFHNPSEVSYGILNSNPWGLILRVLQTAALQKLGAGGVSVLIGVQNAVTDLWRIIEKFGVAYEKI